VKDQIKGNCYVMDIEIRTFVVTIAVDWAGEVSFEEVDELRMDVKRQQLSMIC